MYHTPITLLLLLKNSPAKLLWSFYGHYMHIDVCNIYIRGRCMYIDLCNINISELWCSMVGGSRLVLRSISSQAFLRWYVCELATCTSVGNGSAKRFHNPFSQVYLTTTIVGKSDLKPWPSNFFSDIFIFGLTCLSPSCSAEPSLENRTIPERRLLTFILMDQMYDHSSIKTTYIILVDQMYNTTPDLKPLTLILVEQLIRPLQN